MERDRRHDVDRRCGVSAWAVVVAVVFMFAQSARAATTVDATRLDRIDSLMASAIDKGECPGGVVLVGCGEQVLWRKAYGCRALRPDRVPTTVDTVYDLASLTKVVATATSVAVLVERGQISLTDRAVRYVPEFAPNGKDRITIEELLIHRAGLTPDNSLRDYAGGPEAAMKAIWALPLIAEPGEKFIYSDVGYVVLGEIVRRVSGMPLDEFARREVYEPAGMKDTGFRPSEALRRRCAAHEQRNGGWMIGEVHDPRAFALGGVAGHAGLFSTADDLSRYCRMMLAGGTIDGRRVLSPLTVREMTRPRPIGAIEGVRGLGFDLATGYSGPRGDLFPRFASFGHTGYTGTSLWIDPTTGVYVIVLTNRCHPDGKGDVGELRRRIATVVAAAIDTDAFDRPPEPGLIAWSGAGGASGGPGRGALPRDTQVLTGLDVLVRDGFKPLVGRRVGIITNHTGLTRDGKSIVSVLTKQRDVKVVALFAPEHGFRGELDRHIADEKDTTTGLTIYSLYGETRVPSDAMLEGVDTLVFDIQDIGARFYTYVATMGNCMRAAAAHKIRFVVLDRPNPINGEYVGGPISDVEGQFTSFFRMPVAHGMTVGELARLFNTEMKINADLVVVPLENWSRNQWYDSTGLLWVNPSPNMRNLTQAILYPGVCLIEASNVSVGRGTDEPFERFGAPWIDARKLAAALNASDLPGVRFVPIEFTPSESKFAGEVCGGVHVLVTDREALDAVDVGVTIAWQLRALFGDKFDFDRVNNLLSNRRALDAIRTAKSPKGLSRTWEEDLRRFRTIRAKYLLYR